MPPRKIVGDGKKEMIMITKEDPVYKEKRNKNNDAVKKSRMKTKVKSEETMKKVAILKQENESLEERIQLLSKELTFLKDIFLAHAQKNSRGWGLSPWTRASTQGGWWGCDGDVKLYLHSKRIFALDSIGYIYVFSKIVFIFKKVQILQIFFGSLFFFVL